MPVRIEVCLVGLTCGFEQHRRVFQKGHAERVRTRLHRNADLEVLVDHVVGGLIILRKSCLPLRRFHREHLQSLPVQQQLQLVRLGQTLDVLVAISRQPNLDLVLAVQWKCIRNDCAAASADRKAVQVLFLRQIRGNPDGFAARRTAGTSDGHVADLLRR